MIGPTENYPDDSQGDAVNAAPGAENSSPQNSGDAHAETASDREARYRLIKNDKENSEAWMPATMNDEYIQGLISQFRRHLNDRGLSLAEAAKQIGHGYSQSVLSNWSNRKYRGNDREVSQHVDRWLKRESLVESGKRPKEYVETRIAAEERSVIKLAVKTGAILVITAPSGCGKTFVARMLCDEMNGVFVTANQTLTQKEFLKQILIALGRESERRMSSAAALRLVVEAMKESRRPLFIDEAHTLGKAINLVRTIYDASEIPVVLIGTASIASLIDDRGNGQGQFASRAMYYNALENARGMSTPDDGAKAAAQCLFSVDEVKAFFANRGIRADREALKLAVALANLPGFGSLRLIERAMQSAMELYPDSDAISYEQLVTTLRILHSSDFARMSRMVKERTEDAKATRVA